MENANVSIVKGELTFEDKVIQKIIGIALEEVDGLLTVDGGFFSNLRDKMINSEDRGRQKTSRSGYGHCSRIRERYRDHL